MKSRSGKSSELPAPEETIIETLQARLKQVEMSNTAQHRMFELLGHITAQHAIDDICRATVEGVRDVLGFERAGLFLWDDDLETFRGTYGTSMDLETTDEHEYVVEILADSPEEHILNGATIERGCKLGSPPASPDELDVKADLIGLRVDGRLYGILSVDNRLSRRPITDEELEHLQLLSRVLGNALEISKARLALAESEERFRQVAENSGEWIWELGLDGRYTYSSPVVRNIIGYTAGDVLVTRLTDWLTDDDRERVTRELSAILKAGEPIKKMITRHTHKQGYDVVLETSGIPVRDAEGKLLGYRGVHRDVTRERELESQLRHSQKIEAIGRLAGGIAHDFNNLLTAILGCSDLLLEEVKEGDSLYEDIQHIKSAGERAAVLTRQLLAFSRRQVLSPEAQDVNLVIGEMEQLLRRTIGEDIDFETRLADGLPLIETDADQLQQVILHLALNARDAMVDPEFLARVVNDREAVQEVVSRMDRGEKKLTIETSLKHLNEMFCAKHVNLTPGDYVVIMISDTGVGMPKEVRDHLFEPYFTTKIVGRGSGLGLSTVYGIVQQMEGHIEVESTLGEGSAFRIYLPLEVKKTSCEVSMKQEEKSLEGKETILVVEDEEVVRNLTVRMLQMLGYRTLQAKHGVEALEICKTYEEPIDLILTDMVMPQMSGKQFVEELRRMKQGSKILFVSGYSSEDTVGGKLIGVETPLIQKPFTRDTLANKVREVLDGE